MPKRFNFLSFWILFGYVRYRKKNKKSFEMKNKKIVYYIIIVRVVVKATLSQIWAKIKVLASLADNFKITKFAKG